MIREYEVVALGSLEQVANLLEQGVTARPGARFGPSGIRRGSSRIRADASWSIYTGMLHHICSP